MDVWTVIEANLAIDGNYVGLYGPPGTGKTHAAATYGLSPDTAVVEVDMKENTVDVSECGVTLFSMTMTDGSSEAEMRGHFIPTAEGGKWIYGPAAMAWKMSHDQKTRLVINEVDRASDEVLSLLYAISDDPKSPGTMITLPNGDNEMLRPGPYFTVVATMNGVPEDLPEALQDRFAWIPVNEVNPAALAVLPPELRDHAASSAIAGDERRVSIRAWLRFAMLTDAGMERSMAAFTAFGRDRWEDVLDSISVAAVVARVAAFTPLPSERYNLLYDERFTSFEQLDNEWVEENSHYCGWCKTDDCTQDDPECRPMRFYNEAEFEDYCAAYNLPSDDSTDSSRIVWASNWLHRSHSKPLNAYGVADLTEVQFGERIIPN